MHWSHRGELLSGEDELKEVSVGDHEDDEEGEGEGDLLEGLDNPKQSETKGLKNGEENHPENALVRLNKKYHNEPSQNVLP